MSVVLFDNSGLGFSVGFVVSFLKSVSVPFNISSLLGFSVIVDFVSWSLVSFVHGRSMELIPEELSGKVLAFFGVWWLRDCNCFLKES